MKGKGTQILKKTASIVTYILLGVICVILVSVVFSRFLGKNPSIFGYQFNVIITPSMQPEINVGDVIISKNYTGQKLEAGSVITYYGEVGEYADKYITHKIRSVDEEKQTLVTYGIAVGRDDPTISFDQVESLFVRKSAVLTFIYSIISNPIAFVCLVIIPIVAMISMEIFNIVKEVKEEKQAKQADQEEDRNDSK